MEKAGVSGTKEWSVASVNCVSGCQNGCWYCFGREMAMRFKRIPHSAAWLDMEVKRKPNEEKKKYDGTVMFPTTHDITKQVLQPSFEVLLNLLGAGNDVLIVSKPNLHCVQVLCRALERWRHLILWRFTIGCLDGDISRKWEPNAPPPVERLACLQLAREMGYRTSVSMEPMLDTPNIERDFEVIKRNATESVWLGKMNHVRKRVPVKKYEHGVLIQDGVPIEDIERLEQGQTDEKIWSIYHALKDEPLIRWKESIKKVVGIPLETEAGTDR